MNGEEFFEKKSQCLIKVFFFNILMIIIEKNEKKINNNICKIT